MISAVVLALFVLFTAALIGKILMYIYPESGFNLFDSQDVTHQTKNS